MRLATCDIFIELIRQRTHHQQVNLEIESQAIVIRILEPLAFHRRPIFAGGLGIFRSFPQPLPFFQRLGGGVPDQGINDEGGDVRGFVRRCKSRVSFG